MLNNKNMSSGRKPQIVKEDKGEIEEPVEEIVEEQDISKIKVKKKKNVKGKKR